MIKTWQFIPKESICKRIGPVCVGGFVCSCGASEGVAFGWVWVIPGFGSVFTWVKENVTVFVPEEVAVGIGGIFCDDEELIGTFVMTAGGIIAADPVFGYGLHAIELFEDVFTAGFDLSSIILEVLRVCCRNCCCGRTATGFWVAEDDDMDTDDGLVIGSCVAAIKLAIFSETMAELRLFNVCICCNCCCLLIGTLAGVVDDAMVAWYSPSTSDETPVWKTFNWIKNSIHDNLTLRNFL